MGETSTDIPIEKRTPITEAGGVLGGLDHIWNMWNLGDKLDFFDTFIKDAFNDENVTGAKKIDELKETEDMTEWEGEPFVPGFKAAIVQIAIMQVAVAFAIQAMKAKKNSKQAWIYACEANRWLGVLQGVISGRGLESAGGQKSISIIAALGGKKRDALYEPLRELAKDLVRNKNYKSRRNAAMSIAPEIIKRSKELGLNMSEAQAPITISDWLKDMGFAGKRDM